MAKICVVGAWHQASVVSACFADLGHEVVGVDQDATIISALNAGRPAVYEPKLERILKRNLRSKRLRYTTDYLEALRERGFVYVCIDTPINEDDTSDLSPIRDAIQNIAESLSNDVILCVGAQVPVGTCTQLGSALQALRPELSVRVAYVPEFLRLGTAVESFRRADRFVVGAEDREVAREVAKLYAPLGRRIVITDTHSAEMAKHASNAFLATSISFINELADLCEHVGADIVEVSKIMKLDRRIGPLGYLSPGPGFAGGTLGRDIRSLQNLAAAHEVPLLLQDAVWEVNQRRAQAIRMRLERIHGSLADLRVCMLGMTYKAGTDTLRRSLGVALAQDLQGAGATVKAYDPLVDPQLLRVQHGVKAEDDPYQAAKGCDVIVLLTQWHGARQLDVQRLASEMRNPVFVDMQNAFSPILMTNAGFRYYGVGRGIRPC